MVSTTPPHLPHLPLCLSVAHLGSQQTFQVIVSAEFVWAVIVILRNFPPRLVERLLGWNNLYRLTVVYFLAVL